MGSVVGLDDGACVVGSADGRVDGRVDGCVDGWAVGSADG